MILVMKSLGEILLGYRDDPEKERLRAKLLQEAREWEESEPQTDAGQLREPPPPGPDGDPLLDRLLLATPKLSPVQRQTLQALLDSWGV